MTVTHEWDRWQASWSVPQLTPAELDALIARTRRTRRGIAFVRALSLLLAVAALAIVGAALWHAGNVFEASLGLVVGVGIGGVWLLDALDQRRDAEAVEAAPDDYVAARRALVVRRLRFVKLAWVVLALDLVFLLPWWIGGVKVHGSALTIWQFLTVWAPLLGMAAFVAWTQRIRRVAMAEERALRA